MTHAPGDSLQAYVHRRGPLLSPADCCLRTRVMARLMTAAQIGMVFVKASCNEVKARSKANTSKRCLWQMNYILCCNFPVF